MDPYSILGVSHTASQKEIVQAYRNLSRNLHPDVNPNLSARETYRYHLIQAAYDHLVNKRRFSPPPEPDWAKIDADEKVAKEAAEREAEEQARRATITQRQTALTIASIALSRSLSRVTHEYIESMRSRAAKLEHLNQEHLESVKKIQDKFSDSSLSFVNLMRDSDDSVVPSYIAISLDMTKKRGEAINIALLKWSQTCIELDAELTAIEEDYAAAVDACYEKYNETILEIRSGSR